MRSKYFIFSIIFTIGCYILTTKAYPSSGFFFCLPALIISWKRRNESIGTMFPKWNPEKFLIGVLIVVPIYLVSLLVTQIPKDKFIILMNRWYFIVPLWVCVQSSVILGYYKEKKKAQQLP